MTRSALTLYMHPLASFCWKPLIALYENDTPFERVIVDLGDERSRSAFFAVWPMGKFPVLHDAATDTLVTESSTIVEFLARHRPGGVVLVPSDPDAAREVRSRDRFCDAYVHVPMQKIVGDRIRAEGRRDADGVAEAREQLDRAYAVLERYLVGCTWAVGETFGMADCSAAPALYYADRVHPLGADHPNLTAYLERLMARPSMARVLHEAEPYMQFFPKG